MPRMAPLLPLLLALAACSSGDGGDQPAQSSGAPGSMAASSTPSALFVLGDSLSDVGNAAAAADYVLNQPIEPPTVGLCNPTEVLAQHRGCEDLFYQRSRVSDGAVAVEHLAEPSGTYFGVVGKRRVDALAVSAEDIGHE